MGKTVSKKELDPNVFFKIFENIIKNRKKEKTLASHKEEIIIMLNRALEMEHAARIQYLAHAEIINGLNAEKVIERLKEIAADEKEHEDKFRELIGGYLDGEVSMKMGETKTALEIRDVLEINIQDEKTAIDFYKQIYSKVMEYKNEFPYVFETIEHGLRHIILDEQEHVAELSLLYGVMKTT